MKKIGIHLFHLESKIDVSGLINRIALLEKNTRWRDVSNSTIGLQTIRHDKSNGLFFLDFVKRRHVGPGRVHVNGEISNFEFKDGEDYGEETAAIYAPEVGWLMVQFNQHGPRAGSIAGYLNILSKSSESDITIEAAIDGNAAKNLKSRPILRKIDFRLKTSPVMLAAMRESGEPLISSLENVARNGGTSYIDVVSHVIMYPPAVGRCSKPET